MAYNVAQALKDGLSEEEIAKHLAKTRNYRFDEAVKAGVPHREIIDHLAPQKPISQKPTLPVVPSAQRPREPVVPAIEAPVKPPERPAQMPTLGISPPGVMGVDVMRHRPKASPVTAEVIRETVPEPTETIKEIAKAVPFAAIKGLEAITAPITAPLEALGIGTRKLLQESAEYWRPQLGKIPGYTIDINEKFQPSIKKAEGYPISEIVGGTAGAIGFILGPGMLGMKAGELLTSLPAIEKVARPFYRDILTGMIGGTLTGEGKVDETLQNAALFGMFSALPHLKEIPQAIRTSNVWRRATIKERGLVLQSLEDTIKLNPDMSEAKILRTWNNPVWREEALTRRMKGEEIPVEEIPIVKKPEVPEIAKPELAKPVIKGQGVPAQPEGPEPVGTTIPEPGRSPVAVKPPVAAPVPQPIPQIMGMGQEMEVAPPPVIVKPPPATKTQEEVIGTTLPMGISPIIPPTQPVEAPQPIPGMGIWPIAPPPQPTAPPIQVPTPQPIPQMMGMGQEVPAVPPKGGPSPTEIESLARVKALRENTDRSIQEGGYEVAKQQPRSQKGEQNLLRRGYKPMLWDEATGELSLNPLGVWVKEPTTEGSGFSLVGKEFQGKAYRSETGYEHEKDATAADVARYEQEELGNQLGITDETLSELKNRPATDVVWVTKTKKDARRYGGGVEYDLSPGSKVIATDNEGGFLVLKGEVKPISPLPGPQIEPGMDEVVNRGLPYEEWAKNPALVEDAQIVAVKNGVKPEDLAYVGVQSFQPFSTDAMHLWNVIDSNSPKFGSIVSGPKFEQGVAPIEPLAGEEVSKGVPSVSEEGAKQPWEMTRKEYGDQKAQLVSGQSAGKTRKLAVTLHAIQVRQAIKEGKPVPPEVLKDYPELKGAEAKQAWEDALKEAKLINNPSRLSIDERLSGFTQEQVKKAEKEGKLLLSHIKEGGADKAKIFFRSTHKADFSERAAAGIFFANDFGTAKHYAGDLFKTEASRMQIAELDIKKPYYATKDEIEFHFSRREKWVKELKSEGYDSIVEVESKNPNDMGYDAIPTEVAVFDKSQIRELGVVTNKEGRHLSDVELYNRIKQALSEGKPVPPEVLAEYPDLAPAAAAETGAKGRQPWEMTREEYKQELMDKGIKVGVPEKNFRNKDWQSLKNWDHKMAVQQALSEGKPIPPEVLKDYPELAKQAKVEAKQPKEVLADLQTAATQAIPPTAQHLELMPEEYPNIEAAALKQDGKIYKDHTHGNILIENNLDPEKAIPGFVTKAGKFVEQYPEATAKEVTPSETVPTLTQMRENEAQKADISDIPKWVLDKPKTVLRRAGINKHAIGQMSDEDARKFAIEEYRAKKEQFVNFVSGFGEVTEEVAPTISQTSAKKLLSLPYEQRTSPYGDQNAKFRQQILKELTGQDLPKNKAGSTRVREELTKAAGIDTTGKAPVEIDREIHEWLQEIAGVEKKAEVSPLEPTLPPGHRVVPQEVIKEVAKTTPPGMGVAEVAKPKKPTTTEKTRLSVRPSVYRDKSGFTVWGTIQGKTDQKLFFERKPDADEFVKRVKAGEDSNLVSQDIFGRSKKVEKVLKPEPVKPKPVVEEVPAIAEGESKPLKWVDLPEVVQKNIPKELTDLRTEPYFGTQIIKGEKPAQYNPDKLITYTYDAKTGQEFDDWELGKIRSKVEDEKVYETRKAEIAQLPDVEGKKVEPAKERPVQTQKDQKKYLIDAIDEAIKRAPDIEVNPVLLEIPDRYEPKPIMEKTPHVIIEVPGDGTFRVINSKQALQGFKKVAEERFPGTKAEITPPGFKKISMPSEKPSGRRISPKENSAYEYIAEYSPKRVSEADYATDQNALVGEGWFTNGQYMIKGEPPTGFGKKAVNARMKELTKETIKQNTPSLKDMSPATHVAEFHVMDAHTNSGITISDKGSAQFNPALMDVIRKHQPDATLYIKDENSPMAFVKDKKVVGILMPMRGDPTGGLVDKYFADQGIKVPWEKEVLKEEVKVEAPVETKVQEPWEIALERLSNLRHTELSDSAYQGASIEIASTLTDSKVPLDKIAEHLNALEVARKEHAINPKLVKTDYTSNDIENFIKQYSAPSPETKVGIPEKSYTLDNPPKLNEKVIWRDREGVVDSAPSYAQGTIRILDPIQGRTTVNISDLRPASSETKPISESSPESTGGKKPYEMTQVEWNKVRDSLRPETFGSAPAKSSLSKEVAEGKRLTELLYGVPDEAIAKMKSAMRGEIKLSPEEVEQLQGRIDTPVSHIDVVKKALTSGALTPSEYSRLHEKDYGKIEEFAPELSANVEKGEKGGMGEKEKEKPVDFSKDDAWHDIAYKEATPEALTRLKGWLKENPYTIVRMYHGTDATHPIEIQGIKHTTGKTAKSLQARHGVVSLSIYPGQAETFGRMAYPGKEIAVYAVDIPVNRMVPDIDQLKNKRYWGENKDMGGTLADSIAYGSGVQIKGSIPQDWITRVDEKGEPYLQSSAKGKEVPEYHAKLNENGTVKWQHRVSEDMGGDVYRRDYPNIVEMENDIADKFGRRFATSVERELKKSGISTKRSKTETPEAAGGKKPWEMTPGQYKASGLGPANDVEVLKAAKRGERVNALAVAEYNLKDSLPVGFTKEGDFYVPPPGENDRKTELLEIKRSLEMELLPFGKEYASLPPADRSKVDRDRATSKRYLENVNKELKAIEKTLSTAKDYGPIEEFAPELAKKVEESGKMTRKEFFDSIKGLKYKDFIGRDRTVTFDAGTPAGDADIRVFGYKHKALIQKDLSEGKLTPEEAVRIHKADYPDIETWPEMQSIAKGKKGTAEPEKISDFGKKIGGAKKDLWKERGLSLEDIKDMTLQERETYTKKAHVWPTAPYEKFVEDGMSPGMALLVKKIKDSIAIQPELSRVATSDPKLREENFKRYIELVAAIREKLPAVRTIEDIRNLGKELFPADKVSEYSSHYTDQANKDLLLLGGKAVSSAFQPRSYDLARVEQKAEKTGFPAKQEAWQKQYEIHVSVAGEHIYRNGKDVALDKDSWFVTKKGVRSRKGGHSILQQDFSSREEAEAWAKDQTKSKGEILQRPFRENIERTGPDYRKGKNKTGDEILSEFGFRGGEFGNWTNQSDRQQGLNEAYDALMDLADTLKVSSKALSLNGELGIAFGARGGGSAAAHYEPGRVVINLTKTRGAGSLAHEWAHGVDDYFGRMVNKGLPGKYVSHGISTQGEARKEMLDAWGDVMKAISDRVADKEANVATEEKGVKQMTSYLNSWLRPVDAYLKENPKADTDTVKDLISMLKGSKPKQWNGENVGPQELAQVLRKELAGSGYKMSKEDAGHIGNNAWHLEKAQVNLAKAEAGDLIRTEKTDFLKNALAKGKGKSDNYWQRKHELFARAFESFVEDTIEEGGNKSDYLVHSTKESPTSPWGAIYPQGKDRVAINNAFKKWKESLKTKGEGGKMLYGTIPLILPFLMNNDEDKRKGVKDQRGGYPQPSYLPPGLGR